MFKKFRDLLAIVVMVLFIALWVAQGVGFCDFPEAVIGATISIATMVAMFYFRKKPDNEES